MGFLKFLADNSMNGSLANRFRRRRFEVFQTYLAKLPRPVRILDVGGTEDFWKKMGMEKEQGLEITLLNLFEEPSTLPHIKSRKGDARHMPEFRNGEFDIVFSNSVIEHVGDLRDQQNMASEIRRVCKSYFVQTPARYFPIEPHFLFPFFAVLPQGIRIFLIQHFRLGWYQKIPDRRAAQEFLKGFQLLNLQQFHLLFPEAHLVREKFAGLTKSYTAIYGFPCETDSK